MNKYKDASIQNDEKQEKESEFIIDEGLGR